MLKPTTYRAPRSPRIVVVHIDNLLLLLASMVITGPPLPRARVVLCPESSTAWSSTLIPKAARRKEKGDFDNECSIVAVVEEKDEVRREGESLQGGAYPSEYNYRGQAKPAAMSKAFSESRCSEDARAGVGAR